MSTDLMSQISADESLNEALFQRKFAFVLAAAFADKK